MSGAEDWQQLTLSAAKQSAGELEEALLAAGALAVTLQDGAGEDLLEPLPGEMPLWTATEVTGLFPATADLESVRAALQRLLGAEALAGCRATQLAGRDWVRAWEDDFRPLRCGERLWVCPRETAAPDPQAVIVWLNPGLAFGTGRHPTTALCLEWLDAAPVSGCTVIDYGCGSGILALAAARLGAERVWALDIDPQALLACADNAGHNALADVIECRRPEALPPLVTADVLLANILAGPLAELAPQLAARVRPGGSIVLSGVLAEQAGAVAAAYERWFRFAVPRRRDGWALLQGTRAALER